MIELKGELICTTPEEIAVVKEALPAHVDLTRAEEGCLFFEVRPVGGGVWTVHEQFADMAAFEAHQARASESDWGKQTAGIRRNYQVTEVADPVAQEHDHDHDHDHGEAAG